jgi:prefoldin subunit 5
MVEQIDSLESEVEQLHQALDKLQNDKQNVESMLESTKREG